MPSRAADLPSFLFSSFLLPFIPGCWCSQYRHEFVFSDPRVDAEATSDAPAAAATKSLQSCLTLCDPIDGSPPGSPIPGILQARTLEWVATSFSNAWKWKVKVKSLSRVQLFATPWTAAYQAPTSDETWTNSVLKKIQPGISASWTYLTGLGEITGCYFILHIHSVFGNTALDVGHSLVTLQQEWTSACSSFRAQELRRAWHTIHRNTICSVVSDSVVIPWTVACQSLFVYGISRQENWNELPFPSPGELSDPQIKPMSLALQTDSLLTEPSGKPTILRTGLKEKGTHQLWRLTVLSTIRRMLIRPPITNFKMTVRPDCAVSTCSPLSPLIHPWNSL